MRLFNKRYDGDPRKMIDDLKWLLINDSQAQLILLLAPKIRICFQFSILTLDI